MESGSNKSLHILLGVIVFGIMLAMSYWLLQDQTKSILGGNSNKVSQAVNQKVADIDTLEAEGNSAVEAIDIQADSERASVLAVAQSTASSIAATRVPIEGVASSSTSSSVAPVTIYHYKVEGLTPTDASKFTFSLNGDDTYTITSYLGTAKDVVIPYIYNNKEVSEIGADVFKAKALTSVQIPDTVRTIGERAFQTNTLTDLILPDSVVVIEDEAFKFSGLQTLTLGTGVVGIGPDAFNSCNLTSLTVPGNVKTIGWGAFGYNKLVSVTLSEGIEIIDGLAFSGNKLTKIAFPKSISYVEYLALGYMDATLTNVNWPNEKRILLDNKPIILAKSASYNGTYHYDFINYTDVTVTYY